MNVRSKGSRAASFVFTAGLLAVLQQPQPAVAFHINSVVITVTSINSVTRQVDIDITETTGPATGPVAGANIAWGDAMTSGQLWTSNVGNTHKVSASHTYPDITTRTISVVGDCCGPGPGTTVNDTAQIDFGCADLPLAGCRTAAKSLILLKDNADDARDKLIWKWVRGADTSLAALGDPTASTQYFVCIYAPGPVLQAIVPPGAAAWSTSGTTGFKYDDSTGAAGGVTKGKIKSGTGGKAKILIKGGGLNLDDPLPLVQPVTVQLQNDDGECWEHAFTAPQIENSVDQFKDREP